MINRLVLKILVLVTKLIPNNIHLSILRGPLKGFKWISGAAAGPAKGLSPILNLAEASQLNLASKYIPRESISFDIGANVGLYTLLFSKYSKKVYAFEPLKRNINYLNELIKINNIKNVNLIQNAVSDSTGINFFKLGENYALGKLNSKGNIPVSTITLDDFIDKYNTYPDVIKIDVEGSEFAVLRGAKTLLKKYKPIIFLSTHGDFLKRECINYLKRLNYQYFKPIDSLTIKDASEFLLM